MKKASKEYKDLKVLKATKVIKVTEEREATLEYLVRRETKEIRENLDLRVIKVMSEILLVLHQNNLNS